MNIPDESLNDHNKHLLGNVLSQLAGLDQETFDQEDITLGLEAVSELLSASEMFSKYAGRSKVAVFGSARTTSDSPLYNLAVAVGREISQKGWMAVTGAGGGIMEATAIGSGLQNSLGVNIELPFEQFPSPHIDSATKLVTLQHFFTRKTALTRPCEAFIVLPGGFGTLDEFFEILTLAHTGKMHPAPIVLLDHEGGTYWDGLLEWTQRELVGSSYIGPIDLDLVDLARTPHGAVEIIERFFSNFVSFSVTDGVAHMTLVHTPTSEQVSEVATSFATFNNVRSLGNTLHFDFDGRSYVDIRLLINLVSTWH